MAAYRGRLTFNPSPDARRAAVLILLFPSEEQVSTVFIERVEHINDKHSGQISFPGGSLEPGDSSVEDCALRESHEEIGVDPSSVNILGRLSPLYIPVSNYQVTPVIGMTNSTPSFFPEAREVSSILPVSVQTFTQPDVIKRMDMKVQAGITLKNVPYYNVKSRVIWGATAMIMSEFLQLIRDDASLPPSSSSAPRL